MKKGFCSSTLQRDVWAVALSFASATLTSLQALHPGSCSFFNLSDEQCFGQSATLATLSIFLGSFILMRSLTKLIETKQSAA